LDQTIDLTLGLADMLFESRAQFAGVDGLCHLRKRDEDFLFRVINVLEVLKEQVFERLVLTGHLILRFGGEWEANADDPSVFQTSMANGQSFRGKVPTPFGACPSAVRDHDVGQQRANAEPASGAA
jgi:hypothetical protein